MSFFQMIHTGLKRIFEIVLLLIEFLLALRFIMEFLAANQLSFIIRSLYALTDIFVWPFKSIFPDLYWQTHLVDIVAISAMVGYLLAFFIILGILKFLKKD